MSRSGSWAVPEPRQTRSETKSRCKSLRLCGGRPCASGPRARGGRRQVLPGGCGSPGSRRPDPPPRRGPANLGPWRRAEPLLGGAASLRTAEAVSSRLPVLAGSATPGPRAPESPSPHGLRWCEEEAAGREAPARSTHSLSSTQSTFLVLGGHSSSGVLSSCDVSSTLWPKRRNSIISVPSARLVVCPFSLYF